jgi:diguanylate cyclase (GGDEF)-like protein
VGRGFARAKGESVRRLFLVYALVSLVPVVALGVVLLGVLHRADDQRGLAEARGQADLIARTSIAPQLSGTDLRAGLSPRDERAVRRTVRLAISSGDVLRLRIRDLSGRVVFSDDGSGLRGPIEDEVLDAARGQVVASLTHVNADSDDAGPLGPRAVEIYRPLQSAQSGKRIGVLEVYVPYAPIAANVSADQRTLTLTLGGGLALLWLVLLAVSASVTRRLRLQFGRTRFLAAYDALTGLPNRATFVSEVGAAVDAAADGEVAVAVLDLDGFRRINDSLGSRRGDELLVGVAERLRVELGSASVARLGGDEFGVLFRDSRDVLGRLANLRRAIGAPMEIAGAPLVLEASVGVALAPTDGRSATELLRNAAIAMHVAKEHQLGVVRYHPDYDTFDASGLALVAELRQAIGADELVLHYQPKGSLTDGTVSELEALVRWQHPTRGLLYPDAFIPMAERTELIEDLTRWVVRTAANALEGIDPSGRMTVAVNVSARSLTRADLADDVLAIVEASNIRPDQLVVEITETALMSDPVAAAETLQRLHAAGVRISIDDFGAGQTSLSYLVTLPVSELKIDKTFVLPMLVDARNEAIVRSVIELGHSLGCAVTAEGVEDQATLEALRVLSCDTAQGFHLARPVPISQVAAAIDCSAVTLTASARLSA